MKKVFKGKVRKDWTSPDNYYLAGHGITNSRDIFGGFEDKMVKVTIEDTEEVKEPLKVKEFCIA